MFWKLGKNWPVKVVSAKKASQGHRGWRLRRQLHRASCGTPIPLRSAVSKYAHLV